MAAIKACAILFLAQHSFAETFDSRHARALSANPPDLHFRLEAAGGQRTFRIGDRIPLKLAFSSDSIERYKLDNATRDRSGRVPTEEFVMEREDVTDPCQDYFGVLGWLGGGARGYSVLESKL